MTHTITIQPGHEHVEYEHAEWLGEPATFITYRCGCTTAHRTTLGHLPEHAVRTEAEAMAEETERQWMREEERTLREAESGAAHERAIDRMTEHERAGMDLETQRLAGYC